MTSRVNLDVIGQKYGQLTVIKFDFIRKKETFFICQCDCGKQKSLNISNVKRGLTQSCGCTRYKKISQKLKKRNFFYEKNDYIIGIANNTQREFIIDKEDLDKIKDICWGENNHRIYLGLS